MGKMHGPAFVGSVLTLAVLAFGGFGCSRSGFDVLAWSGDEAPTNWGDFAATLDVPDCPASNPVLTVNTTADELDGGETVSDPAAAGPTLSLFEALWVAANRGTPHNIFFDPQVFPVGAPATIHLAGNFIAPALFDVCLDGRGRGVVIEWAQSGLACCAGALECRECVFGLNRSLMVGLTLRHQPERISVTNSQVAGCRIGTDGYTVLATPGFYLLDFSGAQQIGPGNVLAARNAFAVMNVSSSTSAEIFGNFLGYDPLTRTVLSDQPGAVVNTRGTVDVHDNVFGAFSVGVQCVNGETTIRDNLVGIEPDGTRMTTGVRAQFTYNGALGGTLTLGPGNVITGTEQAASVGSSGAKITRNSIFGNTEGIVSLSPSPPTIVTAGRTGVSGTCIVAGTVEVFSDAADQGETFLGDAPCGGPAFQWALSGVTVPHGRNVTATLTDGLDHTSTFAAPVAVP